MGVDKALFGEVSTMSGQYSEWSTEFIGALTDLDTFLTNRCHEMMEHPDLPHGREIMNETIKRGSIALKKHNKHNQKHTC